MNALFSLAFSSWRFNLRVSRVTSAHEKRKISVRNRTDSVTQVFPITSVWKIVVRGVFVLFAARLTVSNSVCDHDRCESERLRFGSSKINVKRLLSGPRGEKAATLKVRYLRQLFSCGISNDCSVKMFIARVLNSILQMFIWTAGFRSLSINSMYKIAIFYPLSKH